MIVRVVVNGLLFVVVGIVLCFCIIKVQYCMSCCCGELCGYRKYPYSPYGRFFHFSPPGNSSLNTLRFTVNFQ